MYYLANFGHSGSNRMGVGRGPKISGDAGATLDAILGVADHLEILRPPDPLPGLCPWTPLGDSRPQTPCGFAPHPKPPSATSANTFPTDDPPIWFSTNVAARGSGGAL